MLTKKHFVIIASFVKEERAQSIDGGSDAAQGIALRLATYFAELNPNFDRARFLAACGVEN